MAHYKGAASEGTRAQNLLKKREKAKEEFESLRRKIEDVSGRASAYMKSMSLLKFSGITVCIEDS